MLGSGGIRSRPCRVPRFVSRGGDPNPSMASPSFESTVTPPTAVVRYNTPWSSRAPSALIAFWSESYATRAYQLH